MAWIFIIIGLLFVVGAIVALMFYSEKGSSNAIDQVKDVQARFNPNDTRFRAATKASVAKNQAELLTDLNNINSQLVTSIMLETEAVKANERLMNANYDYLLEREKIDEEHKAFIAVSQNQQAVANIASINGIPVDVVKELVLEHARMQTQLSIKEREMELEVEKHRRIKEVDFEFENKMANLDAKMAEMEHLLPQHLINALHQQLSSIHFEYEQVKLLDDGEYKEREAKRVGQKMKALEKNIREREKNL